MIKIALSGLSLSLLLLGNTPDTTFTNLKDLYILQSKDSFNFDKLIKETIEESLHLESKLSKEEFVEHYTNLIKFGYKAVKSIRLFDYSKLTISQTQRIISVTTMPFEILKGIYTLIDLEAQTPLEKMVAKFTKHFILHCGNFLSNLQAISENGIENIELKGRTSKTLLNAMVNSSSKALSERV